MSHQQSFEVLILGCSSASPTSSRYPSAQLINIAERYFLVDCGEGIQMQLRRYKAKFQSIGHLFISHLHGDHFFGVPGLLSSMHLLGRQKELVIYAPEPLKEIIDLLLKTGDTRLRFPIVWKYTNPRKQELLFEDEKVEVYSIPLQHRIECTGFLFKEKPFPRKIDKARLTSLNISFADILNLKAGKDVYNADGHLIKNADATLTPPPNRSYAFCSDTRYFAALADVIKGVDVLYHESTFLETEASRAAATYHSTAKQAAAMAKSAGAKKLVLGHYSARYRSLVEFEKEAKEIFDEVVLAEEGKIIKI